jgi:predicted enzyme related to lactoylglutathione lyase
MAVKSVCGTILMSGAPDALAHFYSEALGLRFEREEHAGLAPHWGVDIGTVHFGIHPPGNFMRSAAGQGSVVLTFDVTSLPECQARLGRLGAPCIQPPHDEGFGMVATFSDPDGNLFEIVELSYQFEDGGA